MCRNVGTKSKYYNYYIKKYINKKSFIKLKLKIKSTMLQKKTYVYQNVTHILGN